MPYTKLTRRSVLATAAASLAAPIILPRSVLGDDTAPPPSEKVAMGYIGNGGRGRYEMGRFMRCPAAAHVAVCDPFKDRREMAARICGAKYVTPDFRELLARKDVDAVSIFTPDHWHVPIACAAARAGKDAFVAKPLGISIEQGHVCREVFEKTGRLFMYGTQQRSMPHCRLGCELVRQGRIGEVTAIDVVAPNGGQGGMKTEEPVPESLDYDMWLGPAPKQPYNQWRVRTPGSYWIYDYAIGYLAGWGAHPLDLMVWGSDADISGTVTVQGTGDVPTEGLYDTVINWDMRLMLGKVPMTFKAGQDATVFHGTDGWIRVWRGGLEAEDKTLLEETIAEEDSKLIVSADHWFHFIDRVKTRKEPVATLGDAIRSDTISHLCDIAVRTGRVITWDPKAETIVGDEEARKMMHRPMRAPWTL